MSIPPTSPVRPAGAPRPSIARAFVGLLVLVASLFVAPVASADPATPKQLENIGIEDRAGAMLPRDVRLVGSDGRPFVLGEYLDGERPLVLVLAYFGCPMLCSLVLNGTLDGMKAIDERPGVDYRVLVVSFDPRDTTAIASEKRASYLGALTEGGKSVPGGAVAGFEFATGTEEEVARLAEAVGFRYRWDADEEQYAHAAGLFVVSPAGKLSQALTGIQFSRDDLSAALAEAEKGVWHSPLKSVLLYCFQYDPLHGRYTLQVKQVLKVGAALTVLALAGLVYRMFRNERRRPRTPGGDGASLPASS